RQRGAERQRAADQQQRKQDQQFQHFASPSSDGWLPVQYRVAPPPGQCMCVWSWPQVGGLARRAMALRRARRKLSAKGRGGWVMAKFDILVHLRSHDGESLAAAAALALARRVGAYVYGLYVAPMGSVAFSTPETVVFQVHEAD